MKTKVYSWRVAPELKEALEAVARRRGASVGSLLEEAARAWLKTPENDMGDDAVQFRLREQAAPYLGSVRGGDPLRAQEASRRVRNLLKERHASRRTD